MERPPYRSHNYPLFGIGGRGRLGFLSDVGPIEVKGDTPRAFGRPGSRPCGLYKLIGRYDDYLTGHGGAWIFSRRNYTPALEEISG